LLKVPSIRETADFFLPLLNIETFTPNVKNKSTLGKCEKNVSGMGKIIWKIKS
jgi:hypothetical protein